LKDYSKGSPCPLQPCYNALRKVSFLTMVVSNQSIGLPGRAHAFPGLFYIIRQTRAINIAIMAGTRAFSFLPCVLASRHPPAFAGGFCFQLFQSKHDLNKRIAVHKNHSLKQ
jgi:hypothetical protein